MSQSSNEPLSAERFAASAADEASAPPIADRPLGRRPTANADWLLRTVDWGFAAIAVIGPCFLGGRHPLGQLALAALTLITCGAWFLRQAFSNDAPVWRRSPADIVLLLGIGLVVLQLTPMSPEALAAFSPQVRALLPLWNGSADGPVHLGPWSQISLFPSETETGLMMYVCYALIFLVAVQRIESPRDVERLLKCVAASAVVMAVIGLAQYLAGNGKFLWVYQHPWRDTHDVVKGAFINQNHFAHLLALGVGPLIWCIQRSMVGKSATATPPLAVALVIALGVVLFAGLMSFSRGGALMIGIATLIAAIGVQRADRLSRRLVVSLVLAFVAIGGALAIHGWQRVGDRLHDYVSGDLAELDPHAVRRTLWAADLRAARDFWLVGSGVGTHAVVYPLEYAADDDVEFTHAENGYVQVLLETGLPGLTLLLAGACLCVLWCASGLRTTQSKAVYTSLVAVSASLAISLLHSLADFVWYLPSLAAITALLAACACRLQQFARHSAGLPTRRSFALPQWAPLGVLCALMFAGYWIISDRLAETRASIAWDRYLTRALDPRQRSQTAAADQANARDLRETLDHDPRHARAHLRLAQVLLREFNREQTQAPNAMPLNQIRDTVMQSRRAAPQGLATRDDLANWMERAFGDHAKLLFIARDECRRGLALCPLLGEGYAYQTDLCFLDGADDRAVDAYVQQARLVRPHSPEVLTIAGEVAALRGRHEEMVELWKPVLRTRSECQQQIVEKLVKFRVPPQFVVEAFEPNLLACRLLYEQYAARETPTEQLTPLVERLARQAEAELRVANREPTARDWLELHGAYRQLGDERRAGAAIERGLKLAPNDFDLRRAAGLWFCELERYDEAEEHLQWCLQRRPSDRQIQQELEVAVRGRVAVGGAARRANRGADRLSR